jgi:hypothetical protein
MIYIQIILAFVVVLAGLSEIYNRKILKKDYNIDIYILFVLIMLYTKDSQLPIVQWLLFAASIMIIFIILDKLYSMIKSKR